MKLATISFLGIAACGAACAVPSTHDAVYAANFEAAPDCTSFGAGSCPGFSIEVPVSLAGGEAIRYCYYFRSPNSATLSVGRFSSRFEPVTAHIIVWTTVDQSTGVSADREPPGTLSPNCGFGADGNNTIAHRIYSADQTAQALRMPDDDGAGNPIAVELPANTAGFVEMYFVNTSEDPVATRVMFAANGRATGAGYTKTATFMTYKTFSIPPGATGFQVSSACSVPASVKFWWFTTHTHRLAVSTTLGNGTSTILTTTDWEHPTIQSYTSPFYQFAGAEKLTTECVYDNFHGYTVLDGDDDATDENCVAVGYFFPATAPMLCYNGSGPF